MSDQKGPSDLTRYLQVRGARDGSFYPLSPSESDFFMAKIPGETSRQRLLAWLRAHVLPRRFWKDKKGRLAGYAMNEKREPLTLTHAAADLGWTPEHTQDVWDELVELGLGSHGPDSTLKRKVAEARLFLRADVKPFESVVSGDNQGQNGDGQECSTDLYSLFIRRPYLKTQLHRLTGEERAKKQRELEVLARWETRVLKDCMAAGRLAIEQREDSILPALGFEKQKQPKRRGPPQAVRVQLLIDWDGQANLFPEVEPAPALDNGQTVFAVAGSTLLTPTEGAAQTYQPGAIQAPAASAAQTSEGTSVQTGVYRGKGRSAQTFSTAVQTAPSEGQTTEPQALDPPPPPAPLKTLETTERPEGGRAGSVVREAAGEGAENPRPPAPSAPELAPLLAACADPSRNIPLPHEFASQVLAAMPGVPLQFFLRLLDQQLSAARQKRRGWNYKWTLRTACDAAEAWPAFAAREEHRSQDATAEDLYQRRQKAVGVLRAYLAGDAIDPPHLAECRQVVEEITQDAQVDAESRQRVRALLAQIPKERASHG